MNFRSLRQSTAGEPRVEIVTVVSRLGSPRADSDFMLWTQAAFLADNHQKQQQRRPSVHSWPQTGSALTHAASAGEETAASPDAARPRPPRRTFIWLPHELERSPHSGRAALRRHSRVCPPSRRDKLKRVKATSRLGRHPGLPPPPLTSLLAAHYQVNAGPAAAVQAN